MIAARGNAEGREFLLMILEPGNIAKLELGQPIVKALKQFIPELPTGVDLVIAYTPDLPFVAARMAEGVSVTEALELAKEHAANYRRATDCERLIKAGPPPDGEYTL